MEKKMSKLLTLLKAYIISDDLFTNGMCLAVMFLGFYTLEGDEEYRLDEYIKQHKPEGSGSYWWNKGIKAPRLRWLTTEIKKLKTKGL